MKRYLWIIFALSIATHFAFFGRPAETVFDEVHFGKFVSGYYTGEYFFDIHPPLGKLIIAGFAKIFDFSAEGGPAFGGEPQYSFTNIGDKFPDNKYLALRFLPVLAGTLLPLVIYLLILELGMSRMAALTAGLLMVFDNALLAQSRLILLDPFLLLFGFASLLFYCKSRYTLHVTRYKILMAIFAGLAISVKWTGLSFVVLPILVETYRKFISSRSDLVYEVRPRLFSFTKFVSFFLISLIIYLAVFVLHFAILSKPGPGDAYMKPGFREKNVVRNVWDLNIEMYKSNQRLGATHPYGSSWYTWPFMTRPIFYWVKDTAKIYLQGNPVIWWASTAAVLYLVFSIPYLVFRKFNTIYKIPDTIYILLGGYFLNLLPFIGIKRVMFLYHYLIPLIFAILTLVYLLDKTKNAKRNFGILITAAIIAFLFFAPLSYGLPLLDKAYEARVWFASWR